MESLVYFSSFLGAALEGELSLVAALQTSYRGYTNLYGILLTAFAGTLTADWFFFLNGRYNAGPFLQKRPRMQSKVEKFNRSLDPYLYGLLLFYRFIYGFRMVLPLVFGLGPVSLKKFALFSLLSTTLWLGFVSLLGHFATNLSGWF